MKVYDSPEQGPLHLCENCWRIENEYNRLNRSWTAAFEPEEA